MRGRNIRKLEASKNGDNVGVRMCRRKLEKKGQNEGK